MKSRKSWTMISIAVWLTFLLSSCSTQVLTEDEVDQVGLQTEKILTNLYFARLGTEVATAEEPPFSVDSEAQAAFEAVDTCIFPQVIAQDYEGATVWHLVSAEAVDGWGTVLVTLSPDLLEPQSGKVNSLPENVELYVTLNRESATITSAKMASQSEQAYKCE